MRRAALSGWSAWISALLLCLHPRAGRAEPVRAAVPAPAGALTRPVPRTPFAVTYPEQGRGEAQVVLELVVDRDGRVAEARVVEGAEPFASAAVSAARSFAFEPARRGAQPVRARIRLEVRFVPPTAAPDTPESPAATDPRHEPASPDRATPPSPPAAPPVEILVLGERAAPGRLSLARAEVRELPGTFGDPFRAIEVMPGVTPILTGVPFFFVRGAPPGNVGYFLDGIRVPLLYHVALGPSVVHPGIVERVDLYAGGYPARYGRFAGGIVAAETTAPRSELRGEANVRLFDAGALIEAPFAGGRGNALVAGRYSYTAAMLSLFAPEVTLAYWDYQARASYDVSSKLSLGLFAFGAYDLFREDEEDASLGTQFHRVDLRANFTQAPATRLRFAAALGVDRTGGGDREDQPSVEDRMLSVRAELDHAVDARTTLRAGADVVFDDYRVLDIDFDDDPLEPDRPSEVFYSRTDFTTGVRADVVWEPEPWLTVTPGLRLDLYVSDRVAALAPDPRLAAAFRLSERLRLEHTFGIAHQPPSFLIPLPGFQLSDLRDGLQRSVQSSAGIVARPGADIEIGATLFHSIFLGLTDFLGTLRLREQAFPSEEEDRLDIRSLGQAYGLELVVKRPLSRRLGGYLAYTLSRSTRSVGAARGLANFDRPHVVHAAGAYDLGRNWRAGARVSAYSGMPPRRDSSDFMTPFSLVAEPADRRSPPFFRLDVRLEKRWSLRSGGRYWSFVLEVLNTTLSREVPGYTCRPHGCEGEAIGPVTIPSLGIEAFL